MKRSKLINILMLVFCIIIISGNSTFANENNQVSESNIAQNIPSEEDESAKKIDKTQQQEFSTKSESLNIKKSSVDESEDKTKSFRANKKSNSRAIINSTWGSSPVSFNNSTGVLTVEAGELYSKWSSIYLDNTDTIKKESVKEIVFEPGVIAPESSMYLFSSKTSIGTNFLNLVAIYGKLDTSKVKDMSSMFYDAENLVDLDVSDWDTSNVITMEATFAGAKSLINLDVSKWDTSRVTTMESTFAGAKSLISLDVSKWDTSQVNNMNNLFYNLDRVIKLDVSKWNTSKVNTMHSTFEGAASLISLDISEWDTSKVSDMSSMFYSVSSITSLDVGKWDTSNVLDMDTMFIKTRKLVDLDVSNWNTSKVTDMRMMFSQTESLVNLDVSKWDTSQVVNMVSMFSLARNLISLDVSKWDTSKVNNMDGMFSLTYKLSSLDVSKWNTSKVNNMSAMFNNAMSLENLDVSKWDTSQVTNMFSMFSQAKNLKSLDTSKWNTSKVTNMIAMFSDASSLTSLDLSSWDTSKVNTMYNMFEKTNLAELILGEKSIFSLNVNLPAIDTNSGEYTGRWERIIPVKPASIYDSSNDFMSDYNGSMTGKYVWQRTSYIITYELDGGINNSSNPASYIYGVGVNSFANPKKDGFDFLGWVDYNDNPITNISTTDTGNKVLYAIWKNTPPNPIVTYTITYELNGGTNSSSNPTSYIYGVGVKSFTGAKKVNYNFLGWYDDKDNQITRISSTDTGNKVLYAKWDVGNLNKPKLPIDNKDKNLNKEKPSKLSRSGDKKIYSTMFVLFTGLFISSGLILIRRKDFY